MGAGASFPDEIDKEMFDSLTDNMFPPQLWKVKCHNYGRYVSGDKKLQVNETEFYLRMKSGVYTFSRPLVRKWDEITANFIDSFFPTYKQNCPFRDSYSFAMRSEEHQPSGSCNFSRIDNATLQLVVSHNAIGDTQTAKVRVYAKNYNVLRVLSGMAGTAYSN